MKQVADLEKVASQLRRAEAGWLRESRMRLRRAAAERRLSANKGVIR